MSPAVLIAYLAVQLRRLPSRLRTALYVGYAIAALLVFGLMAMGVSSVFGVDLAGIGRGLVALAPLFGFTAAANVTRRPIAAPAAENVSGVTSSSTFTYTLPAFPWPAELVEMVRAGRRILYIAPDMDEARRVLAAVSEIAGDHPSGGRTYWANGAERFVSAGTGSGYLAVGSFRSPRAHGKRLDLVVIDAKRSDIDPELLVHIMPALAVSGGQLITR